MMNILPSDIVSALHPINTDAIWRRGDYSAFYQSASGNFLDIAVRFWSNHGELVAHIGTSVHVIIDGYEADMITSVVMHADGRLTSVSRHGTIISGYMPLDTFYLLVNPGCLSSWSLVDKDHVMYDQDNHVSDISRRVLAADVGISLPPLEETSRFDKLRSYMEKLQGVYMALSNQKIGH